MQPQDFPAIYRAADDLAAREQRSFLRLLKANLSLLVVASALSVGSIGHWGVALLQAIALLLALGLAIALYTKRSDRVWYAARALAESVKTLTWRFVSRAEPFDDGEQESERRLQARLASTLRQNRELAGRFQHSLEGKQITDQMRILRSENLARRITAYRVHRISDQRAWYADNASRNAKKSKRFFMLVVGANGLAVLSALLRIKYPQFEFWPTDVLVTLASGVLAFTQAKRFSELAASYALTAHEIGVVEEQLERVKNEEEFSHFVGDAENAFSREHTQWEARKDV